MKKSIAFIAVLLIVACASVENKNDTVPAPEAKAAAVEQAPVSTPAPEEKAKDEVAKNPEWKGSCRKVVNEGGAEVKNSPYKRLQSSYLFEGSQVTWFVKSFADTKCRSLFGGNRFIFNCDANPLKKAATCKQVSTASWTNGAWKNEKMVDHAGYPNELTMVYQVLPKSGKTVSLNSTSITDSSELQTETLTKP